MSVKTFLKAYVMRPAMAYMTQEAATEKQDRNAKSEKAQSRGFRNRTRRKDDKTHQCKNESNCNR